MVAARGSTVQLYAKSLQRSLLNNERTCRDLGKILNKMSYIFENR